MSKTIHWTGWGRWLSFFLAGALVLLSIPAVIANDVAAGWNIFLAGLIFGSIASNYNYADRVLIVVTGISLVRTIASFIHIVGLESEAVNVTFFFLSAAAFIDLRRQAQIARRAEDSPTVGLR